MFTFFRKCIVMTICPLFIQLFSLLFTFAYHDSFGILISDECIECGYIVRRGGNACFSAIFSELKNDDLIFMDITKMTRKPDDKHLFFLQSQLRWPATGLLTGQKQTLYTMLVCSTLNPNFYKVLPRVDPRMLLENECDSQSRICIHNIKP